METPKVGIGVIIENAEGKVLIGKRKGSHAPYYSIPGGHLELGETFEATAIREVKEETDLTIFDPKVISVSNNLRTYELEGKHFISVILHTKQFEGELKLMEEDKCESWEWLNPRELPQPHFDASEFAIACFLQKKIYLKEL